jgi:hypothetical protein
MFNHAYAHYQRGDARVAAAAFLCCMRHGDIRIKPLLFLMICAARAVLGKTGV